MVSLGSFGVSCRFSYQGVLSAFFKGFFGFHLGCLQTGENKAKEKKKQRGSKDRKRSRGAGSRAAKTHD